MNRDSTQKFEDVDGTIVSYQWELPFNGRTICGRDVEVSVSPVFHDEIFRGLNLTYECCGTHCNGVWLDQFNELHVASTPLLEAKNIENQSYLYDSAHDLSSDFLDEIILSRKEHHN